MTAARRAESGRLDRRRRTVAAPIAAPRTSLGEAAYEAIKWRILKMELAPGAFVNVQELADALGLGRSPVHYAVLRLQHDGLLEVMPRKGIVVRVWSREDISGVLEARAPLEIEMARLAAERASPEQVRALRGLLAAGPTYVENDDREALMQLDRAFHQALAECTANPTIVELQRLLHQRSTPLWFINRADRREYAQVQGQHERIAARIGARDPDGAAAAMRAHLGALPER